MNRFRFAAAVAIGLGGLGMFTSADTAAADGLSISPPAIIDEDGFQNYDTSSYLATRLTRRPRPIRGPRRGRGSRRIRVARHERQKRCGTAECQRLS
jgi:hypothetical protein